MPCKEAIVADTHEELCSWVLSRLGQSFRHMGSVLGTLRMLQKWRLTDALDSKEVLAGFDAGGDRNVDEAFVDEQVVRCPLVRLWVQSLLEDLARCYIRIATGWS